MFLMIDNYDSFVFNLLRYFKELNEDVKIKRNKIKKGDFPVHGKVSKITHDGKGIFKGIKNNINVTRYHSLVVDRNSLGEDLEITALSDDGVVMGIRHKDYCIEGVQFHPEAVLTEYGHEMLKNFIDNARKFNIIER